MVTEVRSAALGLVAALLLVSVLGAGVANGESPERDDCSIRVGAVAYAPSAVTVFEGIRRYFERHDVKLDYVLYSNYDALVDALDDGHVDIAWNTPLAHAQYHVRNDCNSQTLVMRDVDQKFHSVLIARKDSGIRSLADLTTKTIVLGSRQAAEATVLPRHFLAEEGVDLTKLSVLSLDGKVDLEGNPCASERHVLAEVLAGRGDAGIVGRYLWERIQSGAVPGGDQLVEVWRSPSFSHCVFTAADSFDRELGEKFTELMLAMSLEDPTTAEVLRLEGAERWIPGSHDGFTDLVEALSAPE